MIIIVITQKILFSHGTAPLACDIFPAGPRLRFHALATMRMRRFAPIISPTHKVIMFGEWRAVFEDMVWRCISKQRTLKVPSWVGLSLILWCSTRNEATRGTTGAVISSHSPSPSIPLVNATAVETASLTITSFSVPRPTPTPHLNETGPERGITSDRVILLSTTTTLPFLTVVSVVVVVLVCVICRRMRSSKTVFRGMCLFFFLCLYADSLVPIP